MISSMRMRQAGSATLSATVADMRHHPPLHPQPAYLVQLQRVLHDRLLASHTAAAAVQPLAQRGLVNIVRGARHLVI